MWFKKKWKMNLQQELRNQAIQHLQKYLISHEPILLIGNRGNKNLWDELILVGLIKLLLQIGFESSNIIVPSGNVAFSKTFLKQFLKELPVIIPEFPKGIRSSIKYAAKGFSWLKTYILPNQILLGGWEILTPETKGSFRYWRWSLLPIFKTSKAKIVVMGGVSPPNTSKDKFYFNIILRHSLACLCRDFESIQKVKKYGFENAYFVMDSSFFALDNRANFKANTPQEKYTINIHQFSHQFMNDLLQSLRRDNPNQIEFVPAGLGKFDKDLKYVSFIEQELCRPISINSWDKDFHKFLKVLGTSKKVLSARLHLFLIAKYMGLPVQFFAYQTKLTKMDKVLSALNI